jgi:hypothetical protein
LTTLLFDMRDVVTLELSFELNLDY